VPIENFHQEVYLEASEQDEKGDWKLWNFSKARNRFVDLIEQKRKSSENPNGYEWLLWMDADDELRSKKLKTLCYYDQYQVHAVQMHSGDLRWPHHRMWKLGLGIKYSGACHEYPTYGGKTEFYHKDIEIYHDAASGVGETSNSRNLRILERELAENPTPRGAFYLGNTYKDAGRWLDAVEPYKKRLAFGHGYADEYYFACLYLGRCLRYGGKADEARQVLLKAAS
jgi:tetratricopeptide (TPR) repeat protein